MKVTIDHFEGQEVERVYFATSVEEATLVEKVLDATPFTYTIDLEGYVGAITGALGPRGVGAAFLVSPSQAEACKRLLLEKGLVAGVER